MNSIVSDFSPTVSFWMVRKDRIIICLTPVIVKTEVHTTQTMYSRNEFYSMILDVFFLKSPYFISLKSN